MKCVFFCRPIHNFEKCERIHRSDRGTNCVAATCLREITVFVPDRDFRIHFPNYKIVELKDYVRAHQLMIFDVIYKQQNQQGSYSIYAC